MADGTAPADATDHVICSLLPFSPPTISPLQPEEGWFGFGPFQCDAGRGTGRGGCGLTGTEKSEAGAGQIRGIADAQMRLAKES